MTTTHHLLSAFVVACALSALTPPAAAAPFRRFEAQERAPLEGVQPGLYDADGRPCVKQCPDDRLPCDPPNFKTADGRCSDQWR